MLFSYNIGSLGKQKNAHEIIKQYDFMMLIYECIKLFLSILAILDSYPTICDLIFFVCLHLAVDAILNWW